jgi:hypothetical protein
MHLKMRLKTHCRIIQLNYKIVMKHSEYVYYVLSTHLLLLVKYMKSDIEPSIVTVIGKEI